jgi:transcriptional regulator with XRE-family HTH domain
MVTKSALRVLTASTPGAVARAAAEIGGDSVEQIESALPRALAGERSQVRLYVDAYRELTGRVVDAAADAGVDALAIDEDGQIRVAVQAKSSGQRAETVQWMKAALEHEAVNVPFSGWVGTLGVGRGTAGAVAALVRAALPGVDPLIPPNGRLPNWQLDDRQFVRFSRAVLDELSRADTPLEHIGDVLGLTQTELAGLFGVRRQALDQWATRGVPAERQEKVATLGAIADLLGAKLKRDRIPGVVRRHAPAYGDRSILDAIAAGDEDRVLEELQDAFDWSAAA